jgi:hypothetical protein
LGSPVKEPPSRSPWWNPKQRDAPPLESSFTHLSKSPVYEPSPHIPGSPQRKGAPWALTVGKLMTHWKGSNNTQSGPTWGQKWKTFIMIALSWLTLKPHTFPTQIWRINATPGCSVSIYHWLSLTLRWLMSYIYGAPILDVSRSHTTQHSR